MKRTEVWWVEFDPAVGSEIRKTRPAVIVSNNAANRNLARVVVVPITSNTDRLYPGEALVTVAEKQAKRWPTRSWRLIKADSRTGLEPCPKPTCWRWRMPFWFIWECPDERYPYDYPYIRVVTPSSANWPRARPKTCLRFSKRLDVGIDVQDVLF